MSKVKSLNDLEKLRQEVFEEQRQQAGSVQAQVLVAMGTCGIAAGADATLKSIQEMISARHLAGIQVSQTGCVGLCGQEPVIQVICSDGTQITYGKVTPKVARRVISEHLIGGTVLQDYVVQ